MKLSQEVRPAPPPLQPASPSPPHPSAGCFRTPRDAQPTPVPTGMSLWADGLNPPLRRTRLTSANGGPPHLSSEHRARECACVDGPAGHMTRVAGSGCAGALGHRPEVGRRPACEGEPAAAGPPGAHAAAHFRLFHRHPQRARQQPPHPAGASSSATADKTSRLGLSVRSLSTAPLRCSCPGPHAPTTGIAGHAYWGDSYGMSADTRSENAALAQRRF